MVTQATGESANHKLHHLPWHLTLISDHLKDLNCHLQDIITIVISRISRFCLKDLINDHLQDASGHQPPEEGGGRGVARVGF